jgi:hypothetical protein
MLRICQSTTSISCFIEFKEFRDTTPRANGNGPPEANFLDEVVCLAA